MPYDNHFLKIEVFFSHGKTELTIKRGYEGCFTTSFLSTTNKNINSYERSLLMLGSLSEHLKKKFKKEYHYDETTNTVTFSFGKEPMAIKRLNSKVLLNFIENFIKKY